MKMIFQCSLLLLYLGSVRTSRDSSNVAITVSKEFDSSSSFSFWPSLHNGSNLMRIRKRELEQVGANEGGGEIKPAQSASTESPHPSSASKSNQTPQTNSSPSEGVHELSPDTVILPTVKSVEDSKVNKTSVANVTEQFMKNITSTKNANETAVTDSIDLSGPGVFKRGAIVFGGFALLAVAYFVFYRRKGGKNDANSTHSAIDANQFRYGVLQSDDRRDNLELSRVPLTMESDEDEEEDLEIFDLEQKKKSLSYVNLQMNDEEVVNGRGSAENDDRDNLLLDIEDVNTDPLINWSNNDNKSIL